MGLGQKRPFAQMPIIDLATMEDLQSSDPITAANTLHARQPPAACEAHQSDGVTLNALPSSEALDRHAVEPHVGRGVRRNNDKPTAWDPFARYHSSAHSFPDYGSKHVKMERFKKRACLKTWLPFNSLYSSSKPSEPSRRTSFSVDDRPAKRHKKEDAATDPESIKSPFFNGDDVGLRDSQDDHLSNTQDEIRSTSSVTTKRSVKSLMQMPEYRKAQLSQKYGKKDRGSRVRMKNSLSNLRTVDARPTTPGNPLVRTQRSDSGLIILDSPDVLAIDDEPPPARVTSDLQRPPKFLKRESAMQDGSGNGPHIKRQKASRTKEPVDISEDELQGVEQPSRKLTNFSNLSSRRRQARGDIQPTQFTKQRFVQRTKPVPKPLCLVKAVSPRHIFPPSGTEYRQVYLHLEEPELTHLIPKDKKGAAWDLPWLVIDLTKIQGYRHCVTHSPYIEIKRPQTSLTEVPPKLLLEFADRETAVSFVDLLPSTAKSTCVDSDILGTEMGHMTKKVVAYRERIALDAQREEKRRQDAAASAPDVSVPDAIRTPKVDKSSAARNSDDVFVPDTPAPKITAIKEADESDPALHSADVSVADVQSPRLAGRETRRLRKSPPLFPFRDLTPPRWTEENPGWDEQWSKSLVFPATGKNRAIVDKDDISRLDEGQFLNDNLIYFYIRYLQTQLEQSQPDVLKKVYIFNTFFFEKLRSTRGKINYDGVKAWTAKVDIFSYDYVIVPVNESAHWYLAIICNTPNTLRSEEDRGSSLVLSQGGGESAQTKSRHFVTLEDSMDDEGKSENPPTSNSLPDGSAGIVPSTPIQSSPKTIRGTPASTFRPRITARASAKNDPSQPRIITLDSLGSPHSPTCTALKEYLIQEANDKKSAKLEVLPTGMTARGIPEQDNYCDCGVFILGYMEEFLRDPDGAARKLLQKEELGWDVRAPGMRNRLRDLLFSLQRDQQKRLVEETEKKRKLAAQKKAAKSKQLPSSPQVGSPTTKAPEPASDVTGNADVVATPTHSNAKFVKTIDDSPDEESTLLTLPSSTVDGLSPARKDTRKRLEVQVPHRASTKNDEILFIEGIPDSPTELDAAQNQEGSSALTGKAHASHSSPRSKTNIGTQQRHSPRRVRASQPLPSIERDDSTQTKKGARYEGIDRAIDISGEA